MLVALVAQCVDKRRLPGDSAGARTRGNTRRSYVANTNFADLISACKALWAARQKGAILPGAYRRSHSIIARQLSYQRHPRSLDPREVCDVMIQWTASMTSGFLCTIPHLVPGLWQTR